ncbi:MAG: Asp23/Gls24 family envelope stress response protein [Chloroflexi bacterium]|nr:MAG: Asp23/Gls24 family envelope stress response protein [Chloroflexota bacterium]
MAQSSVTISPDVVRTIVRNTVLAMPSVRGLVDHTRTLRPRDSYRGIQISMDGDDVRVELHLTAAQDVSLVELGRAVQSEVQQAVREILGLRVSAVDVYFEDVTA